MGLGYYAPCVPELMESTGNEINAAIWLSQFLIWKRNVDQMNERIGKTGDGR